MTLICLALAIVWASAGMWLLCYWAPHCPEPANPCRRFILIAPLRYVDPWNEQEEPDPKWLKWVNVCIYSIVIACMIYPLLGVIVLGLIAMGMAYIFIQKITETGPYAQTEGEQNGSRIPATRSQGN